MRVLVKYSNTWGNAHLLWRHLQDVEPKHMKWEFWLNILLRQVMLTILWRHLQDVETKNIKWEFWWNILLREVMLTFLWRHLQDVRGQEEHTPG